MKKFNLEMDEIKQFYCVNCHELWPSKLNYCLQCKIDNIKYSRANDMISLIDELNFDVKKCFEELTMIEEMLISPILVIMSVFRLPGGALTNRGFCANFSQNIQPIINILPRVTKDLPILILKKKDQMNRIRHFVVNKRRVFICLDYLCKNNPQYIAHGIKIDQNLIDLLPDNGIPQDFNEMGAIDSELLIEKGPELFEETSTISEDNISNDEFIEAYVENDQNEVLLDDKMKNAINFPQASMSSLNEYTTDSICSLAFPKLFPNGTGDPTKKARIKDVTEALAFKHLMKSAAKSYKTDDFYYPWAQHPRFRFWAYNKLRRQRSLEQFKVYLKHNIHDANLTIKDLKDLINSGESDLFMKKMSTFTKKRRCNYFIFLFF